MKTLVLVLVVALSLSPSHGVKRYFPDYFEFGVATASYQVEGAWNVSDKSENIWDRLTHTTDLVADGSTGDVACDSYHNYKRDVEMLLELGVNYYRFSISWARLLPTGFVDRVSQDGLRYYSDLLDELIGNGIEPMITLYHWDLPQSLQDLGGWTNPRIVDYFEDYANFVFETFGDRVQTWLTLNEPMICCSSGYGSDEMAPALNLSGTAEYLCSHNMLKAHARVYHLYHNKYKAEQKGRISLTLNSNWYEPSDDTPSCIEKTEIGMQFELGWFAHPIFSTDGDYPKAMKDNIKRKSAEQGFPRSRLPEFTQEEIEYIKGTYDFFGVNHYTTYNAIGFESHNSTPSYNDDREIKVFQNTTWEGNAWLKTVPWGFTKLLDWIKKSYNNPEIRICENGFLDFGELEDFDRIEYVNLYLNALLDAMDKGVNVTSYTAWSLMDNFEWLAGYGHRFGLYQVDFENPNRPRKAKLSAGYYQQIIENRYVDNDQNLVGTIRNTNKR